MPIQKEIACKGKALDNIEYIINPNKTTDEKGRRWVATYNMLSFGDESANELYQEFVDVNMQWGKNKDFGERKYYHVIINFKGYKIIPENVLEIGFAYLKKFYLNHQAVLAVHISEDGLHLHICVNSVDMETGYKVNRTQRDLIERKDFVNDYSYEHFGIEPFDWRAAVKEKRAREKAEKLTGNKDNYNFAEQLMHAENRTSELDILRARILKSALLSKNRQELEERLSRDYGILMPRNTENTLSFKYKESTKGTIRGSKLGDRYTAPYIDKILLYNRCFEQGHVLLGTQIFADLETIAKEKNYEVSRQMGFGMSQFEFENASENELTCRYASTFVKNQNRVAFQNRIIFVNGQKVKTHERLQRMYDATVAAQKAKEKYGCDNMRDLERKQDELEELLVETTTQLKRERKIESALKNKVNQRKNLCKAAEMVCLDTKTLEEQNSAKHLLYRNGIKKEQFKDPQTAVELSRQVVVSQQKLEEQQTKTKEVFCKQKELQKEIQTLETAINGVELANDLRFYYGDNLELHIGVEQKPKYVHDSFEETADLSVEELENKTDELVSSVDSLLSNAIRRSQRTDKGYKDLEDKTKEI